MKRNVSHHLQAWWRASNRKPLIIKGIRQCGKTYSLIEFGKDHFPKTHIINFEQIALAKTIFDKDLDPKRIITQLSFFLDDSIDISKDLLIFDEIQECPNAITSLKYFSEQMPEIALCCAGSLLGLTLSPSSFPVGKVDFISLSPMSFQEFLWALEATKLTDFLNELTINTAIPEVVHDKLWTYFKWYCVTGGLPEVVQIFISHKDDLFAAFAEVRKTQLAIIKGYYADFAKHAGKQNAMHIERIFTTVPSQLTKARDSQAPKYQFKGVVPGIDRYQGLVGAIDWLVKAGLVIKVPVIRNAQRPLLSNAKESAFKLYCFDVGMLGSMTNLSVREIIDYNYGSYKGYMAENFIAQQLSSKDENLFCWQYDRSEIEFLLEKEDGILPVEVKAGHIVRAKSLDKYELLYSPKQSLVLSAANMYGLENATRKRCPLYAIEFI